MGKDDTARVPTWVDSTGPGHAASDHNEEDQKSPLSHKADDPAPLPGMRLENNGEQGSNPAGLGEDEPAFLRRNSPGGFSTCCVRRVREMTHPLGACFLHDLFLPSSSRFVNDFTIS